MDMSAVEAYFVSPQSHKPFYLVVGDEDYKDALVALSSRVTSVLRVSNYCHTPDRKPNLDRLKDDLQTADVSCEHNRVLVLGLGEYLALEGEGYARSYLQSLKDFNLGAGKAVLLLRGVAEQVKPIIKGDKRLKESGRIAIVSDTYTAISLQLADPELDIYENRGLKAIILAMENGDAGIICASTAMNFPHALLSVKRVKDAYEAIVKHIRLGKVNKQCGTDDTWDKLLEELRRNCFKLSLVFEKHGMRNFQTAYLHDYLARDEYEAWLCYLYLLLHKEEYAGQYLGLVLDSSCGLDEFKKNLIYSIATIRHTSPKYKELYKERKRLLYQYTEAEMTPFVLENSSRETRENVYALTDLTMQERQAIIIWIGRNGRPDFLSDVYPDLADYLSPYTFDGAGVDSNLAALLTDYIESYKQQKVSNRLEQSFSDQVDELALQRIYNRLPHRDELVKEKRDDATLLVWIDALGLEYIGFISRFASNRGLSMSVQLGRASLPTITCVNKSFFEEWPEKSRTKVETLDEVKHKEKGGFRYGQDRDAEKYPVYLARELDIIRDALEHISTELVGRKHEHVVIASDHGASRLAVLHGKEEKYPTDTQGKHSGRCCKFFEGCDLKFAIKEEESGYITLADYGRFAGSRAANVEVHGGATLEEVVVPLITLSLADNSFSVKITNDNITADYKRGIKFSLSLSKYSNEKLALGYDNQRYLAQRLDDYNYVVEIPVITKAGTYSADAYLGDNLVEHLDIVVSGRSAMINDDFDDLF